MAIEMGTVYAVAGAGIALGVAGISTALGVKAAGIAAAGAVAENKENFKSGLVLEALPQTQTIYAFIIALLIMMGAGLLGTEKTLTTYQGLAMLGAGLLVAITGMSAIIQGMISGAGVVACAKNPEAFGPSIVFSGQAETPAIFGFIAALIMLVVGMGVLG